MQLNMVTRKVQRLQARQLTKTKMLSGPPSPRDHSPNGGRLQPHCTTIIFIMSSSQGSQQRGNGRAQVEHQMSEEGIMLANVLENFLLEKAGPVERLVRQCIEVELETLILLKVAKAIKANPEFALLQNTNETTAK